jgi:hypothetical protein
LAVDRLRFLAPNEIPIENGAFQIGNRIGGLLLGLTGGYTSVDSSEKFLGRQIAKFMISIADCWLIANRDYHSSYAIRRVRFANLGSSAQFSKRVLKRIDRAFGCKLGFFSDWSEMLSSDSIDEAQEALEELECALLKQNSEFVLKKAIVSSSAIFLHKDENWLKRLDKIGMEITEVGKLDIRGGVSAVYRALIAGFCNWNRDSIIRAKQIEAGLTPHFHMPPQANNVRLVAKTWFELCH